MTCDATDLPERARRSLTLLVALVLGCVGLSLLAPTARAADASTTFVTMVSEQGDYIGQGSTRLYRPGSGTVTLSGSVENGVNVQVAGSAGDFTMSFRAPSGESLGIGQYDNADGSAGHGSVFIYGDGRGCTSTGRFTVLDIHLDADPALSRLWLLYEQHCDNAEAALFGEIRINEPGGDSDLLVAPGRIEWPDEYPGASGRVVPVRLVNTGTSPLTVSSAAITAGAPQFTITSNGCTTIAVGASCAVNVRFAPTTSGDHTGTLTITDSTVAGIHTVTLGGTGIAGHTSWAMRSQQGDYIGQGEDWSWTPQAGDTITASGNETSVRVRVDEPWFDANFEAPTGQVLQPGTTYTGATRYPFNGANAGLDVGGDGRGCNTLTGQFTVHEASFDEGGKLEKLSITFEQHCEGGTEALFGSIAWMADNPAQPLPPRITVTTDRSAYSYGAGAKVTVAISNDSPDRTVSVYATPQGKPKQLVTSGTVNSLGKLILTVPVYRRTTFSATVDGVPTGEQLPGQRVVTVKAKVVPAMVNYSGRSGKYYLYKYSKNAAIKGTVSPNHAGDCLWFRAQFYVDGAWRYPATTDCVHMTSNSWAKGYLAGDRRIVGVRIRMRAEWKGDTENAAANSVWRYVRFTR